MSWVNPVFPIDAKNSIGFFVQFFLSQPGLVGDSVQTYVLTIWYSLWRVSKITDFYQLARQICKIEPALEKATFQYRLIETP